jgi:hypothetical protein
MNYKNLGSKPRAYSRANPNKRAGLSGGPKTWARVSQAPFGAVQRGARVLGSGGRLTGNSERVMQTSLFSKSG